MKFTFSPSATSEDKSLAVEKLITHSTPSSDFYVMVILAIAMATIGLLLDSASIIIGSMLISPMLYVFLSLSLGFSLSDKKLIRRSAISIIKATVVGIIISALITLFVRDVTNTSEILARTNPSLAYAAAAFIAGFAAAFTLTKPTLSETLPGVAIAVSIIPPVAVSGIGLATLQWSLFRGSIVLFIINMVSVFTGSLVLFLLLDIHSKKDVAQQTLKEEDKKL
ncbi:MAG: TIGR00341 family protein [Candidatus Nomurabacteria bacterium]|nr:MAG: TIGR00341 family protein [Candidatus Nomurabacteria bacterium]